MSVFLHVSVCVASMPGAYRGQKLSRPAVKKDREPLWGHWKHRVSARAINVLNC